MCVLSDDYILVNAWKFVKKSGISILFFSAGQNLSIFIYENVFISFVSCAYKSNSHKCQYIDFYLKNGLDGWLVGLFYGISTFVGYLTPNPF